jgi:hypothetical protein
MRFFLTLLACVAICAQPLRAANEASVYVASTQRSLTDLDRHIADGHPVDARDLGYAAFAVLLLGGDGGRAARYLERETGAQLPDGRYVWTLGQTAVPDPNAIDFAMQDWGPILLRYGTLLPANARNDVVASAQRAIPALIAHHVSRDYTNIALMNGADLLELGTALHNDAAVAAGRARLADVQSAIAEHGICEFSSPTYSAVQLSVLGNAYASLEPGSDRDLVGALLASLWSDLAQSTFDGRIAGAHSRDYSFVGIPGTIALFLASASLAPTPPTMNAAYATTDILFEQASGSRAYVIPQSVIASARQPIRYFTKPWGSAPDRTRTTFIDVNVAIGTNATDYPDGQEKPLAADIAGVAGDISLNAVDTGDPYGATLITGKDGHRKPHELPLHMTLQQNRGAVSGTTDLDLGHSDSSVELSLLIPSGARVTVNGSPFSTATAGSRALATGDLVTISGNNGATVTFRFVAFRGAQPSALAIVADSAGLRAGAVRVTATYPPSTVHAYAAFEMLARND